MHNAGPVSGNQRGIILIIGSVALLGVLVISGLVIDFGMWFVTREELQNVTDAATLAGGRELGLIYTEKPIHDQQTYSLVAGDISRIGTVIDNIAGTHQTGGVPITIAPADIVVGDWNFTTQTFSAQGLGTPRPNAVQVTARRDSTNNTPLATVFGQLLNITSFNVIARATAALSPLNQVPPGTPPANLPAGQIVFPIGVDSDWENFCAPPDPTCLDPGIPQLFNGCISLDSGAPPANTCTAWTTFNSPNSTDFGSIVSSPTYGPMTRTMFVGNPLDPVQPTPPNGTPAYYFWGDADSQSAQLLTHPDFPASNIQYFNAIVPVYQNNCLTPDGSIPLPIVGFLSVRMTRRSDELIIKFACDVVSTGRSGEPQPGLQDFGTWGSIPVLVQ